MRGTSNRSPGDREEGRKSPWVVIVANGPNDLAALAVSRIKNPAQIFAFADG
jgi:hypothetical protein